MLVTAILLVSCACGLSTIISTVRYQELKRLIRRQDEEITIFAARSHNLVIEIGRTKETYEKTVREYGHTLDRFEATLHQLIETYHLPPPPELGLSLDYPDLVMETYVPPTRADLYQIRG